MKVMTQFSSSLSFCEYSFRNKFGDNEAILAAGCDKIEEIGKEFGFGEVSEDQAVPLLDLFGLPQEVMM